MRMFVASPKRAGKYPGILFYSDIFQLTGPMVRATARLAGYGFVVAAPEIYHRIEPAGTVIPFDDEGRTRGWPELRKHWLRNSTLTVGRRSITWINIRALRKEAGRGRVLHRRTSRIQSSASTAGACDGLFLRDGNSQRKAR
jgi:hypothetical protein